MHLKVSLNMKNSTFNQQKSMRYIGTPSNPESGFSILKMKFSRFEKSLQWKLKEFIGFQLKIWQFPLLSSDCLIMKHLWDFINRLQASVGHPFYFENCGLAVRCALFAVHGSL